MSTLSFEPVIITNDALDVLTEGVAPDRRAPGADHLGFAVPVRLTTSWGELRLITAVTTFNTAVDVTISELKLETFLPADSATSAALARTTQ